MILVPTSHYSDDNYKETSGYKLRRLPIEQAKDLIDSVKVALENHPDGKNISRI